LAVHGVGTISEPEKDPQQYNDGKGDTPETQSLDAFLFALGSQRTLLAGLASTRWHSSLLLELPIFLLIICEIIP
jgi:hypothetical protein